MCATFADVMVGSRNKKETAVVKEGEEEEEGGKKQEYITAILPGQGIV